MIMKRDGSIAIKGKDVRVTASAETGVIATEKLILKGTKIEEN